MVNSWMNQLSVEPPDAANEQSAVAQANGEMWVSAEVHAVAMDQTYAHLLSMMSEAVFIVQDGCLVYVNPAGVRLVGQDSPRELLGQPVGTLVIAPDLIHLNGLCDAAQKGRHSTERLTLSMQCADGTVSTVEVGAAPCLFWESAAAQLVMQDVSDAQRMLHLRDSDMRYRRIVETAHEGIWLADASGITTFVNRHMAEMLGYTPDEMVGTPIWSHIPPPYGEVVKREIIRSESTWQGQLEGAYLHRDRSLVPCIISTSPFYDDTGKLTGSLTMVMDRSDREQREQMERDHQVMLDTLFDLARALNSSLELSEVLELILTQLGKVVPHDAADIVMIEGGMVRMVAQRGYERRGGTAFGPGGIVPLEKLPILDHVVRTSELVTIPDVTQAEGWVPLPPMDWIRSHIKVPIRIDDQVIGVIHINCETPGQYTPAHGERLRSFARQAALAIQNAQLYGQARQRAAYLTALNDATSRVARFGLDLEGMLRALVETLVDREYVSLARIWVVDGETKQLELEASAHAPRLDALIADPVTPEMTSAMWGRLTHLQAPMVLNTLDALPDGMRAWTDRCGFTAMAVFPMMRKGELLAVLATFGETAFDDVVVDMLGSFTNQAAVAIENGLLYQELARQNESLEQAVRARTRELAQMVEHVETLINAVGEGLCVLDPEGRIEQVNPAFELQTGYSSHEVQLKTYERLLESAEEYERLTGVLSTLTEGYPWRGDMRMRRKDGSRFDAALTISVVTNDVTRYVCSIRDVSAAKDMERMKDALVSNVSHELRTPLSSMVLQLGTLDKYYVRLADDERRTMVGEILEQATVLMDLINDILSLARFDAHQEQPRKEWFDVAAMIHDTVEALSLAALEKDLTTVIDLPAAPCAIHADPAQIARMFRNLYGNAIKYTPPGGRVTVGLVCDGQRVTMTVRDTGIGIAPHEQAHLFERFFRSEEAARMASGTGLGLPICHEIVELHEGTIDVESEPGKGARFTVRLPRDASRRAGPAPAGDIIADDAADR